MHIYLPEPSFQGNRLFVPSQEQTDKKNIENKKMNISYPCWINIFIPIVKHQFWNLIDLPSGYVVIPCKSQI